MRAWSFGFLAASSLWLTACSDKGSTPQPSPPPAPAPAPQIQKATVTGQIQPALAITSVTATNAAGVSVAATPTSTGTYTFPDLVVGVYTLAFLPVSGYLSPANQSITVALGGTTVPLLTVVAAPLPLPPPPPPPPIQRATFTGQLQPADAITLVTATNATGVSVTATPTSAGTYSFPDLVVGPYTLAYTPAVGYIKPTNRSVTLVSGGTSIPLITVGIAPPWFSYQVDGVTVTPPHFFRSALGTDLTFSFFSDPGGASGHSLFFFLSETSLQVGTYSLNQKGSHARYKGPNAEVYESESATSGTITITAVETSPRRMSGTFRFVGKGVEVKPTSPATKTVTQGTFTNVPY